MTNMAGSPETGREGLEDSTYAAQKENPIPNQSLQPPSTCPRPRRIPNVHDLGALLLPTSTPGALLKLGVHVPPKQVVLDRAKCLVQLRRFYPSVKP